MQNEGRGIRNTQQHACNPQSPSPNQLTFLHPSTHRSIGTTPPARSQYSVLIRVRARGRVRARVVVALPWPRPPPWVPTKRNGPFLRHYGATVPHKMPYSYRGLSLCLRRHWEREYAPNSRKVRAIFALIFAHMRTSTAWRAPTQVGGTTSHCRMSTCPRPAACGF